MRPVDPLDMDDLIRIDADVSAPRLPLAPGLVVELVVDDEGPLVGSLQVEGWRIAVEVGHV